MLRSDTRHKAAAAQLAARHADMKPKTRLATAFQVTIQLFVRCSCNNHRMRLYILEWSGLSSNECETVVVGAYCIIEVHYVGNGVLNWPGWGNEGLGGSSLTE